MSLLRLFVLSLLLVGCRAKDADDTASPDADGDGVVAALDCDDNDAGVHPGAPEVCDGLDNDCDGAVDLGAIDAATWYADTDGDGHGDAASTGAGCEAPSGFVADDTDCDDADAGVHPGAVEVCDGVDNDCDGAVDGDPSDPTTFYLDFDADGFGGSSYIVSDCAAPEGSFSTNSDDCDDADPASHPGAVEVCDGADNDCDGLVDVGAVDVSTFYADGDNDGFGDPDTSVADCEAPAGFVASNSDCDDTDGEVHPGETELCDGVDGDCDGVVDESGLDATTWYLDADNDGFGDLGASSADCTAPSGYVASNSDCDDADASVNPGATEFCDGLDNDCDGSTDGADAIDASDWFIDSDDDGYGSVSASLESCDQPSGYVATSGDCDDADSATRPGAVEVCDGLDNDCDGLADDSAADATEWFADTDSDGFGAANASRDACDAPAGFVADGTDCDDTDATLNPGASETCDGLDDDCDGDIDESSAIDATIWYLDADADGYGNGLYTEASCAALSGYVGDSTDCDDLDSSSNPGATEVCDSSAGAPVDNDRDGGIDEGVTSTFYADSDDDGYGDAASTAADCSAPSGYVSNATDCDDADATANPSYPEVCDGIDNDCDGAVDVGAIDASTWYADNDADGYGDAAVVSSGCEVPAGYAGNASDCDDGDAARYPGASETCDDLDDDCDGVADEGVGTLFYWDGDRDGYGDSTTYSLECAAPGGYVTDSADCDDGDAGVYPGAPESCDDGVVNGCDGAAAQASCWSPPGALSLSGATTRFTGEAWGDFAGRAVSEAGRGR